MKNIELVRVLEQRKKECQKHLKSFNDQLKEMRGEKEIGFDREMLGGMQHQIGYMTGVIDEINNTIKLTRISEEEFLEEKKQVKEYEKAQRKKLKALLKESVNRMKK